MDTKRKTKKPPKVRVLKDYRAYKKLDIHDSFVTYFSIVKFAYQRALKVETGWSLFCLINMLTDLNNKEGFKTLFWTDYPEIGKSYVNFLETVSQHGDYWGM